MDATRTRSTAFFILYLVVLLAALAWVQSGVVRSRAGEHVGQFYALIAGSLCYLGLRTYLVLGRGLSRRWSNLWLSVDMGIITAAVYLTGGINSEAALVYFWPIATSSIQRLPRRTIAVSVATGLLYALATWPSHHDPKYAAALPFRLVILAVVAAVATYFAVTEQTLVNELVSLREGAVLADYRARLSREMHDGIQHYLADIAVRLELARRLMATELERAARMAVDQRFVARQAAAELRYLVRRLRSPSVEREGFADALRNHLSLFAESSSISASLEIESELSPVPREVAQAAFRLMQEALMNAEKHAQATEVRVTLGLGQDCLVCKVKDNGIGFDPESLPPAGIGGGFGLPGMTQRAESLGGKVEVRSAPGQGTEVVFTLPAAGQAGRASKGA
jgi:signal transduction histidine kinase